MFCYIFCRPESTIIEKIIQRINNELDRDVPSVSEHLVGMESRVQEMLDLCLGETVKGWIVSVLLGFVV